MAKSDQLINEEEADEIQELQFKAYERGFVPEPTATRLKLRFLREIGVTSDTQARPSRGPMWD